MAVVLAGCGQRANEISDEVFQIVVVFPGMVTDHSDNQAMYESVIKVQESYEGKMPVEFLYTEGVDSVSEAGRLIDNYAKEGADLIIAHSAQYASLLPQITEKYPHTSFAISVNDFVSDNESLDNVFTYAAQAEQGGYILGFLAASLSDSGKIGIVVPANENDIKIFVAGIIEGAKAVNDAETVVTYTGSYFDLDLFSTAIENSIAADADILIGSSSLDVNLINQIKFRKINWIGNYYDQTTVAPNNVIANQIYDWSDAIEKMIQNHLDGVYGGENYLLSLGNKGLSIQLNESIKINDQLQNEINEKIDAILSGELVPVP
jgi:basic membrane protein A